MPLDPRAQALLIQLSKLQVPWTEEITIDRARREMVLLSEALVTPLKIERTRDVLAPAAVGSNVEIPVRVYYPSVTEPLPMIVFFHGGGWVLGNIATHEDLCRRMAVRCGTIVASVDYRLAPEHKFPAAFDDCYAATRWLAEHARDLGADPHRIAVAGDSAGGNLAAAVTLAARDAGSPHLAAQVLLYPVTDYSFATPSYTECGEGYYLTRQAMEWFWSNYLATGADGRRPFASPLRAETLGALPPALIITAHYDPLRDEGQAYAERLARANVQVEHHCFPGMFHGFARANLTLTQADEAVDMIAKSLRKTFGMAK